MRNNENYSEGKRYKVNFIYRKDKTCLFIGDKETMMVFRQNR